MGHVQPLRDGTFQQIHEYCGHKQTHVEESARA